MTTSDSVTTSELWRVTYDSGAGNWIVWGSVSGTQTNRATGGTAYNSDNSKVSFTITESGIPSDGDQFVFDTVAASGDSNTQKTLLFGDGDPSIEGGKSGFVVEPSGSLQLSGGSENTPTIIQKDENNNFEFNIKGSLDANRFEFDGLSMYGLNFSPGATISNLLNGSFVNGGSSGTHLNFESATFDPASFLIFDNSTTYDVEAVVNTTCIVWHNISEWFNFSTPFIHTICINKSFTIYIYIIPA